MGDEYRDDNPCARCDARCCRHYAIHVLPHEAEAIAEHLGQPIESVVALELEALAPELPVVYIDGQPSQLVLARDPDSGACAFLDAAMDRCTIHDHVPYICQMYPFTVIGDDPPLIRLKQDIYCVPEYPLTAARERRARSISPPFWGAGVDAYRRSARDWNFGGAAGGLVEFLEACRRGRREPSAGDG